MLTGTIGTRAFIHHDRGVPGVRGHDLITLDGDGQRCRRGIAVRIRDGIGKVFRIDLAIRHVYLVAQLVRIGAVRVQRQLAVGTAHGLAGIAAVDRSHHLVRRGIRAEHVVFQHALAADALLRRSLFE